MISRETETKLPTEFGEFRAIVYEGEHLALTMGTLGIGVLVRIHSESFFEDRFGSSRTDIHESMKLIRNQGRGVLLYIRDSARVDQVAAGILHDLGLFHEE